LSSGLGTAIDLLDPTTLPLTTDDLTGSYEPDPIAIPMHDVLDGLVGSLTSLKVGRVDADTIAWARWDATGLLVVETMRLRVDVGDANSITLGWDVELDAP
jgi:hypothetical protein